MVLDWEWEVFHFPTDLIFAHLALAAAEIFALAASLIVRFTGLATTGTGTTGMTGATTTGGSAGSILAAIPFSALTISSSSFLNSARPGEGMMMVLCRPPTS